MFMYEFIPQTQGFSMFQFFVADRIAILRRLKSANEQWGNIAKAEHSKFEQEYEPTEQAEQYGYDPITEEAIFLESTERVLWASLATAISSTVEASLGELCDSLKLKLPERANWGTKRNALEGEVPITFGSLDGFESVNRARVMSNCFKHNDGRANEEFSKLSSQPKGEEIDYELEDWDKLIADTQTFLESLSDVIANLCPIVRVQ